MENHEKNQAIIRGKHWKEFFKLSDFRSRGCWFIQKFIWFMLGTFDKVYFGLGLGKIVERRNVKCLKIYDPTCLQGDWSGRGQAIVLKFDHKLFEALCDHHKSSCLILPIISTSHFGMPAHFGTIFKNYSKIYEVPRKSQGRVRGMTDRQAEGVFQNRTHVHTTIKNMLPQSDPIRFSKWLQPSSFWL